MKQNITTREPWVPLALLASMVGIKFGLNWRKMLNATLLYPCKIDEEFPLLQKPCHPSLKYCFLRLRPFPPSSLKRWRNIVIRVHYPILSGRWGRKQERILAYEYYFHSLADVPVLVDANLFFQFQAFGHFFCLRKKTAPVELSDRLKHDTFPNFDNSKSLTFNGKFMYKNTFSMSMSA